MSKIFAIIGFIQVLVIIGAFASAMGRTSVMRKWKTPDLFFFERMENFFVKILNKK